MKKIFNAVLLITLLAGASFISCADDESRSSLAGDATVIINLGLPPDNEIARLSIIDRVLRFFSNEAVAAAAPAAFGNISIRVTGDGIGSIAKDVAPTSVISMTVPGGGLRTFEVTAQVAPGDPSAALSFYGSTVANVPSGGTVSIPILMSVNETKLLVPDMRNQRLVLLDSVSTAGWNQVITTSQLGTITGGLYPYDIDYDSRGRIYIANGVGSGTDIIRVDDLSGTNRRQYDVIIAGIFNLTNVIGIAIDRKRDILYCISSTDLFAIPLGNIENGVAVGINNRLDDPANGIWSNLMGIDVDDDGNLYIVCGSGSYITKYNPVTDSIIYQLNTFPSLNGGYDIIVEKPFLYVLNSNGAAGYQTLKYRIEEEGTLSATYTLVEHFGTKATGAPDWNDGMFYGPRKFVGMRSDGLYIIDNYEPSYWCKMVWIATRPTLGAGWAAFSEWGTGNGQFKFYCSC